MTNADRGVGKVRKTSIAQDRRIEKLEIRARDLEKRVKELEKWVKRLRIETL